MTICIVAVSVQLSVAEAEEGVGLLLPSCGVVPSPMLFVLLLLGGIFCCWILECRVCSGVEAISCFLLFVVPFAAAASTTSRFLLPMTLSTISPLALCVRGQRYCTAVKYMDEFHDVFPR